mgnify:CR=1 FL=1
MCSRHRRHVSKLPRGLRNAARHGRPARLFSGIDTGAGVVACSVPIHKWKAMNAFKTRETMLAGAMAVMEVGDPMRLATDVGPVIDAEALDGLKAHLAALKAAGQTKIAEAPLPARAEAGTFLAPTAWRIDSPDRLTREVFGPVLHIWRYEARDLEAVVQRINAYGYGLTMGVHSRIDRTVRRVAELGAGIDIVDYMRAVDARVALGERMAAFHRSYDLLVTPSLPITAFEAGHDVPPGSGLDHWMQWTPFTYPFNLTGQPAASIPCGFDRDGLPVGLQIVGPVGADALVLRVARAFERVRPIPLPPRSAAD